MQGMLEESCSKISKSKRMPRLKSKLPVVQLGLNLGGGDFSAAYCSPVECNLR